MAASNKIRLPLIRKKREMDIESLGHGGTSYVVENLDKFSPQDVPGMEPFEPCLICSDFLCKWIFGPRVF